MSMGGRGRSKPSITLAHTFECSPFLLIFSSRNFVLPSLKSKKSVRPTKGVCVASFALLRQARREGTYATPNKMD